MRHFQSQMSQPIEETDYSEFDILVCYAPKDKEVAFEMKRHMEEHNLRVCIDVEHFIVGEAFSDNICNFIRCSKTVVFLLTSDFLDKKWSHWEMQHALLDFLEKESSPKKKKIIPILLKQCRVPDALRPYTPLDFQTSRDWKRLASAVQSNAGKDTGVTGDVTKKQTSNTTAEDLTNDVTKDVTSTTDVTNDVIDDITNDITNDVTKNVTNDAVTEPKLDNSTNNPTEQASN